MQRISTEELAQMIACDDARANYHDVKVYFVINFHDSMMNFRQVKVTRYKSLSDGISIYAPTRNNEIASYFIPRKDIINIYVFFDKDDDDERDILLEIKEGF